MQRSDMPGDGLLRLGKYEIKRTLGRGATGTVYEGWDPVISRRVAIRTVHLPDADEEAREELARFRREAQAAGRLTHPNLVGVYDYGESADMAYIVMEFVDGKPLKAILDAEERLALPLVRRVMDDVLSGLEYSHGHGVIHRDIKPANVMLTSIGQAKIADFGIARIESSSMTQAGTVLGTPAYMSPEQFMGMTVDLRTDVYSSGVLLYQLLTGEKPFEGSLTTIMHKVLDTVPPRPSELSLTAPAALDQVVATAMARRPEDRFPSATAFGRAIHAALDAPAAPARPLPEEPAGDATVAARPRPAVAEPELAPLPSARSSGVGLGKLARAIGSLLIVPPVAVVGAFGSLLRRSPSVARRKPNPALLDSQSRVIDANLLVERSAPGEIATLTVTIRLPSSRMRGKWQEMATLSPARGPVRVLLEAHGLTPLSEPPPPVEVPEDRDAAPVAFELRIEEASERWLHIVLTQEGQPVGELTITDFSAVGEAAARRTVSSPFRSVAEADLMLIVRAGDGRIEACSPRERASLDHVTLTGFRYPETSFREQLADRLRALYDSRSNAEEAARELQLVGAELASCLPAELVKLLRHPDIRSVMLRHEVDFDFPLELCYLDDPRDPFFVGDRVAICRWYLGLTSLPDVVAKSIRKVAFLRGDDAAAAADEALLARLYPGRTVAFTKRSEIVDKLFKTSEFDLIHFTGHCRQRDSAVGGLELADGNQLRLIEIGQLESERAFAAAQPFVMLNACASAQPYLGLTQHGSFAHRFVDSRACAVVGTLWPVAGAVANEFAMRFYAELARKPVGQALLAAKLALMHADADGGAADDAPPLHRLARQVAVRSYCLFANPDLRLMA